MELTFELTSTLPKNSLSDTKLPKAHRSVALTHGSTYFTAQSNPPTTLTPIHSLQTLPGWNKVLVPENNGNHAH